MHLLNIVKKNVNLLRRLKNNTGAGAQYDSCYTNFHSTNILKKKIPQKK